MLETILGLTDTEFKMLASGLGAMLLAIFAGWKGVKKNEGQASEPMVPVSERTARDVDAVLRILGGIREADNDHKILMERVLERIMDEQTAIRRELSILLDRTKR